VLWIVVNEESSLKMLCNTHKLICIKVLCPTPHKIGHFRGILHSQSWLSMELIPTKIWSESVNDFFDIVSAAVDFPGC